MAQNSYFWETDGVGDGDDAGITATQMREVLRALFAGHVANLGGVRPDYLNELAVSGSSSPVAVATGLGVVYGLVYANSASENVAIPTPSVNSRIDRIVLRADFTARTVRITRIAGSEAPVPAAPALTQVANTTWDVPLAQALINTGGSITITDEREWLTILGDGAVSNAKLADGAVDTDQLADDAVTQAKQGTNTLRTMVIPLVAFVAQQSSGGSWATLALSTAVTYFDADKLPDGATVKLCGVVTANGTAGNVQIRLYNQTDGAAITGSEATATSPSSTETFAVSSDFAANLPSGLKQFRLQAQNASSNGWVVYSAFLLVEW